MSQASRLGVIQTGARRRWRLEETRRMVARKKRVVLPRRGVAEQVTTFAGKGRIGQLAIAGKLTARSSPIGAIVSSVI